MTRYNPVTDEVADGAPVKAVESHAMAVSYTNDDDGIWIFCSCGDMIHVGFHPTPEEIVRSADEHAADRDKEDS